MKLKIEKVFEGKVQTKNYGEKPKLYIHVPGEPNNVYSCFKGKWNSKWKDGDEVEVGEIKQGNTTRDKDGKETTWFNVSAPLELQNGGKTLLLSKELESKIEALEARVKDLEDRFLN